MKKFKALFVCWMFQVALASNKTFDIPDITHNEASNNTAPEALSDSNRLLKTFRITPELKREFVEAHNKARRIVSPTATDMREMSWDNELERLATGYSKQCLFEHNQNRKHSRFSVGENIYMSTWHQFDLAYARGSVGAWDQEKDYYTFSTRKCQAGKMCGHYTQVVWATTFRVGCGASLCSRVQVSPGEVRINATLLVCNYGPPGNIPGRPAFQVGTSCSACDKGDTCQRKLCTNPIRDQPKPKNPTWSEWSSWSPCSATCGFSYKTHSRTCSTFVPKDCKGHSRERVGPCAPISCSPSKVKPTKTTQSASWSPWSQWSTCSKTCNGGRRTRHRICDSATCRGNRVEVENCNTKSCPRWSRWRNWSACSETCGGGFRSRTRTCSTGSKSDCVGRESSNGACNTQPCPSTITQWSKWSPCSKSCGTGSQSRQRVCSPRNSGSCSRDGIARASRKCNTQPCPSRTTQAPPSKSVSTTTAIAATGEGKYSPWSQWTKCSKTCGVGTRRTERICLSGKCVGSTVDLVRCFIEKCPTPVWSKWGNWGECSESCDAGNRSRKRTCIPVNIRDICIGSPTELEACNSKPCSEITNMAKNKRQEFETSTPTSKSNTLKNRVWFHLILLIISLFVAQ